MKERAAEKYINQSAHFLFFQAWALMDGRPIALSLSYLEQWRQCIMQSKKTRDNCKPDDINYLLR